MELKRIGRENVVSYDCDLCLDLLNLRLTIN
jgi:hypothetical protein